MVKLFSIDNNSFLKSIPNSELQLNKFLCERWEYFFPQYTFIKSEFPLSGVVRTAGNSGRIDILAFNTVSNKLAVFELKRESARNIRDQAGDYRDKIVSNFHEIYLQCTQEYDIELPKYKTVVQDSIEIVLISKSFFPADLDKVKSFKDGIDITLIKYSWFENDLVLIEYLNNIPTESVQNVKPIVSNIKEPKPPREVSKINVKNNSWTILRITINDSVFEEKEAINSLIKAIRLIGPERIKKHVDTGSSYPLVISKDELHQYISGKYKSIDDKYYVYSYNSTLTKTKYLADIAKQLNEKIEVEIIQK